MSSLPWMVVHGAWIWRLALLGLVTIALFYPWLRARLGRIRRPGVAASESPDDATGLDGDDIHGGLRRGPGPIGARVIALVVALLLFSFVFLFGASVLDSASERVQSPEGGATVEEILEMHRSSRLLAATPFGRKKALRRIHYPIHLKGVPGADTREALVALRELQGCCQCAMDTMLMHRQFSRTLEYASRCDEPRARLLAARAALALGRIEKASDLIEAPEGEVPRRRDAIRVHLLAGEISRAGDAAERTAEWWVGASEWARDDAEASARRAILSAQYSCLAHALRAREGDSTAKAELDALLEGDATIECRLLAADLRDGEERAAILSDVLDMLRLGSEEEDTISSFRRREFESLALLLQAEKDPVNGASLILSAWGKTEHGSLGHYMPRSQLVGHDDRLVARGLGLERGLLETLIVHDDLSVEAKTAKTVLAFRAAVDASLILRHDEALRLLTIARENGGLSDLPHIGALEAFIEFRRGDLDAVRKILDREVAYTSPFGGHRRSTTAFASSAGQALLAMVEALEARELPREYHPSAVSTEALDAALKGDGELLAAELRTPLKHIHPSTLHSLAPLVHWLPAQPLFDHLRYGRFGDPFEAFAGRGVPSHLVSLARIAEVIGDDDLGPNLVTAMHDLYDAALRPEIALPWILLEHF